MKKFLFLLWLFFLKQSFLFSLTISSTVAMQLGEKIWQNECRSSVHGLTTWNQGENFGSFGIGHFIWYPENERKLFQESFPSLLAFFKENHVILPIWLKHITYCPWVSKADFEANLESLKMRQLRQLLLETKDLQARFIANHLEKTVLNLLAKAPVAEKEQLQIVFDQLIKQPNGLYALMDYLNFKGSGLLPTESYQGQGWGLLQVLQEISPLTDHVVKDFVEAAKKILTLRVKNAPSERKEERWLKGWLNRLDTYLIAL